MLFFPSVSGIDSRDSGGAQVSMHGVLQGDNRGEGGVKMNPSRSTMITATRVAHLPRKVYVEDTGK